jgi:hypothetical protein
MGNNWWEGRKKGIVLEDVLPKSIRNREKSPQIN